MNMLAPSSRLLLWAVVASLLLAGCGGKSKNGSPDASPDRPARIQGVVTAEEGLPLPGATVRVLLQDVHGTTDEQGRYVLDDVHTGPVRLVASAGSTYSSQARDLVAVPGVVHVVSFELRSLPSPEPRIATSNFEGLVSCGILQGVSCQAATGQGENVHRFSVDPGLEGVIVEVEWTPSAPTTAQQLTIEVRAATSSACGVGYAQNSDASPLRLEVSQGFPLHGGFLCIRVSPANEAPAVNQDYSGSIAFFYHRPLDPDHDL